MFSSWDPITGWFWTIPNDLSEMTDYTTAVFGGSGSEIIKLLKKELRTANREASLRIFQLHWHLAVVKLKNEGEEDHEVYKFSPFQPLFELCANMAVLAIWFA